MRRLLFALPCILATTSALAQTPALDEVTRAVAAGDYKQITSVVVARDGKVLYEHSVKRGQAHLPALDLGRPRGLSFTVIMNLTHFANVYRLARSSDAR